uniref:Uncharacterized protein n=3 Tax=unclassified bacterial viruses TaxID=12333 RepID=A0AAU6VZK2_9VIRU
MKNRNKDWRKVPTQAQRQAARDRADRRNKREDQRCSWQDGSTFNGAY